MDRDQIKEVLARAIFAQWHNDNYDHYPTPDEWDRFESLQIAADMGLNKEDFVKQAQEILEQGLPLPLPEDGW